ncbi:Ebp2-domain-containing protein [Lophium mytilinum]|uniref:Ebp2-domain-containing protein n=1 Tax=Lophium mytilinum TaxID=390894 RepID=A0A6A6QCT4_9PEZI|nr:Ebp2-domain-containing protein [Lophium mytilinum]
MAKSKLLGALDRYKGRDLKLEKQRKQEKEARKRKLAREEPKDDGEDEDNGGVLLGAHGEENIQSELNGKAAKKSSSKKSSLKKSKTNSAAKPADDEEHWETEEDEEGGSDDEDDMPVRGVFDTSRLDDIDDTSESESEQDEEDPEEQDEDEEDEEDDIALSDIESLASEDRGDIIPHQRLTINNTTALTAALHRIQLPLSKMDFSEHQSVTTSEPVEITDVEDDLNRELAFYKQSLSAVTEARKLLKKEGAAFSRPVDYFAEMVKSDEHMGKIKQKLIDSAASKKASADARRQRDLKKFGKQVQIAKLQERDKAKRETLDKISLLKRKRQGQDLTKTNEEDLFDVTLDETAKPSRSERKDAKDGRPNPKRQKKDEKHGFGGKKRFAKSNDAKSSADMSGFSNKRMREDKDKISKTGASKRLGKNRRAKRN